MSASYIPDAGDIVWLNFTPQTGHEQAGRRSIVVLSPKVYNSKTGFLVCVPITSQIKGYPFEVLLSGAEVSGAALADQVKNLDWRSRQARYKGKISISEIQEIRAKIAALLKLV